MATSLMLRDDEGKIIGYVLLLGNRLLARMNGGGEAALLTVLSDTEASIEFPLICDQQEHELPFSQNRLRAAYVSYEGRLIAATCAQAEAAFRQLTAEEEKKNDKNSELCKKAEGTGVYTERKIKQAQEEAPRRLCLQGRWPQPPCWPRARYVGGVWTEGGV